MVLNPDGSITNEPTKQPILQKAQPVFNKVKDISSIFLDNSVKTSAGYLFDHSSMTAAVKKLTTYLKNNP